MLKRFFCIFTCIFFVSSIYSQKYQTGCVLNDTNYQSIPIKAKLLQKDYQAFVSKISLKNYCPVPGNQSPYSNCTAWATAYAARTILYAIQNNITDKEKITEKVFSPWYIYTKIKPSYDIDCSSGTDITYAFNKMIVYGVPFFYDFNVSCPASIPADVEKKAALNKIQDYNRLFNINDSEEFKIASIKKSLSENLPVVIGIICPNSFFAAQNIWIPVEDPNNCPSCSGHALCIIGYDDNVAGGAFEIMNSWGYLWGNDGFIWVKYSDLARFTKYAVEPVPYQKIKPDEPAKNDLACSISLILSNNQEIKAVALSSVEDNEDNIDGLPEIIKYKTTGSLISGQQYRMYLSINEPAFVYVFCSDLTNNVSKLFPHDKSVSPFLCYKKNNIAIPDEDHLITLDNTKGKDFLCFLYSKTPLDIDAILDQLKEKNGDIYERLQNILDDKLVLKRNIQFAKNELDFSAKSENKECLAVIIEMKHL